MDGAVSGDKKSLPWFKLAKFGDRRTEKNCLRNNQNVLSVTGIEADYDAGEMPFSEAERRLSAAQICALIYTTPSHTEDKPRWRVFAPFEQAQSPEAREGFMARLNGVFDGTLAGESFTLSQSYYAGNIEGMPRNTFRITSGRFIDQAADMDSIALGKGCRKTDHKTREPDESGSGALFRLAVKMKAEGADFNAFTDAAHNNDSAAAHIAKEESAGPNRGQRALQRAWERAPSPPACEFEDVTEAEESRKTLTFLSPAECVSCAPRGYVIKGLIAPRDVGCIFGDPGAGKSLIAPYLGYRVARGDSAFGMRTKAGRVFYVAAEDPHGMRGRIKGLHGAHGNAADFVLVEGVSDLLTKGSPDRASLWNAAREQNPALIFIDTLALAFPGLEENSAEGMGRVVAFARKLTECGSAVMLIHHGTKAEGNTPRGHSLLNGALDTALQIMPRDESGVVRARLTKNRNGSCDRDIAFRIAARELGIDKDGDSITTAICAELSPGTYEKRERLTPSEKAALDLLAPDDPNFEAWRRCCSESRTISASESLESRQKATRRALQGLIRKGYVTVSGEQVRVAGGSPSIISESFDDLSAT